MRTIIIVLLCFCLKLWDAHCQVMVLNGLTHEFKVSAGEMHKGFIDVQNAGGKPVRVSLTIQDYTFEADGSSYYQDVGSNQRTNGHWVTLSPAFKTFEAGEQFRFLFEIQVPKTDSLRGTFWSMVMVESDDVLDTTILQGGFAVSSKVRYGVQLVSDIKGDAKALLEFRSIALNSLDSAYSLAIDIFNIGEIRLRPKPSLELFGDDGEFIGRFEGQPRRLYPGTSYRYEILLPYLVAGTYSGILMAETEGQEVFGTQITLEISDD